MVNSSKRSRSDSRSARGAGVATAAPSGIPLSVLLYPAVVLGLGLAIWTILEDASLSESIMSRLSWNGLHDWFGHTIDRSVPERPVAHVGLFAPLILAASWLGCWLVVGRLLRRNHDSAAPLAPADRWKSRLLWSNAIPGLWFIERTIALLIGWESALLLIDILIPFMLAGTVGGTLWSVFGGRVQTGLELESEPKSPLRWVSVLVGGYVLVFFLMNLGLWRGVWIPHGDSAMYEEHLWNLTHGKGFRSYLDQGLFLGEHIQVIHLLLLPVHWIWPSLIPMEFCESLALASGAFPIFWMARRHGGSARAALLMSAAYLLYPPLQFLDIAIDLKTFRPISFGVPAVLFALDQLERRRFWSATGLLLLALSAKEDFPLIFVPLGGWIAIDAWWKSRRQVDGNAAAMNAPTTPNTGGALDKTRLWFGGGLAVITGLYLILATRYFIPWFRSGVEVHYASYFSDFGDSLTEVAITMLTRPDMVLTRLATLKFLQTSLLLLLPIGFVCCFSPLRFAVGVPLLVLLGLNQLASDPRHHFHAPLVPILFWAACAGLPRFTRTFFSGGNSVREGSGESEANLDRSRCRSAAMLVCTLSFACGVFFSISPAGLTFWDPGSRWNWRSLYVPTEREKEAIAVSAAIPKTARVASTDFIHPRFTHHERSYDYSNYVRRVAGWTTSVPDDTDFIVLDLTHPYSEVRGPEDVPELNSSPDSWQLRPDLTGNHFLVIERVNKPHRE